jgi:hypothetical protein
MQNNVFFLSSWKVHSVRSGPCREARHSNAHNVLILTQQNPKIVILGFAPAWFGPHVPAALNQNYFERALFFVRLPAEWQCA